MRFYRLLLHLFPRTFREANGADMARQFADELQAVRGRPIGVAGLWARGVGDVIWHAVLARLRVGWTLSDAPGQVDRSPSRLARRAWLAVGSDLSRDFRLGTRRLVKAPAFTLISVVTLGLGIGSATALFSVVDAVLLRPLPWPEAKRLVSIYGVRPDRAANPAFASSWNRGQVSWPAWHQLRESAAFEAVGVWRRSRQIFTNPGIEDGVDVWYVSKSFLSLLGADEAMGRLFNADEDDDYVQAETIILPHETWLRRFGGRPDVIGEKVHLAYQPGSERVASIIGVLRADVRFTDQPPDFLLPIGQTPPVSRTGTPVVFAIGRLAPGVSIEAAAAAAEPIVRGAESPDSRSARLVSLPDELLGSARRPLWVLFGAAGILLLVACANVAGLLIAEARARRHEIAVRVSLGCGRARVLRQLTVEHLLLGTVAAAAGLGLAVWMTPLLVAMAPARLPGLASVAVDLRVAGFAMGLGVLTVLIFGAGPALTLSSTRPTSFSSDSRSATARHPAAHRAIVAGELGLALILLVCASLFGETLLRLTSRPLGFDPSGLAVISVESMKLPFEVQSPTVEQYLAMSRAERVAHHDAHHRRLQTTWTHTAGVLQRLNALPGVVAAAAQGLNLPFGGRLSSVPSVPLSAEGDPSGRLETAFNQIVTDDYFETMGMPIVRGRGFASADRGEPAAITSADRSASTQAIVSRELERRLFPDGAVGRRLVAAPPYRSVYEVIGVVPDIKQRQFTEAPRPSLYVLDSMVTTIHHLLVKTAGDPAAILPAVRQTIRDYDPSMIVTSTTTMEELIGETIAHERFRARLSSAFGGAALLLAAIGIYSLAARRVAERRREIGVRVALGARPIHVRRLVLRETLLAVTVGLLLGIPLAVVTSQLVRSLLFEVSPTSPRVFGLAAAVLATVALAATVLPASRASRIDPMLVLRE
jgi:predicted permease